MLVFAYLYLMWQTTERNSEYYAIFSACVRACVRRAASGVQRAACGVRRAACVRARFCEHFCKISILPVLFAYCRSVQFEWTCSPEPIVDPDCPLTYIKDA
jgi:hypothetical protein